MTDMTLKQRIEDELDFEPSVDAADIGVAVENGIVTLSGHVPTYGQKAKVEEIVGRLKGVRGFAEEIEVRPVGTKSTADDVLANRAADLIRWNAFVPDEAVKVNNGVEVRIDDPELAARLSAIDAVTAGDLVRKALLDHLGRGGAADA